MRKMRAVGRNVLRKEGVSKVTGAAQYIDDLTFPGLLYGRTIRSTWYAHGLQCMTASLLVIMPCSPG